MFSGGVEERGSFCESSQQIPRLDDFYYGKPFQSQKEWIEEWCQKKGYTDLQYCSGSWWAIPPGGYIPVPLDLKDA